MIFDSKTKLEFLTGYRIYDGVCGPNENKYAFVLLEKNKNKLQHRNPKPKTKSRSAKSPDFAETRLSKRA